MAWITPVGQTVNSFSQEQDDSQSVFVSYKKEIAAALALVLGVLSALGILMWADQRDLTSAKSWARQPWIESSCTVEEVGVAYRGNCDLDVTLVRTAYQDFAECMGPHHRLGDVNAMKDEWEQTPPGLCEERGNLFYQGSQVHPNKAKTRRLAWYRPERVSCHNSFLPWAMVKLANTTGVGGTSRCAYQFGASLPSIIGDWDSTVLSMGRLQSMRGHQGGSLCWVLGSDYCVVAFRDQRALARQLLGERSFATTNWILCAGLAALLSLLALRWQLQEHGACPLPSGGYHMALPTSELEPEELLSERVRQILGAAAGRLTETTPSASGNTTLRVSRDGGSHRTVEVVLANGHLTTVSRNIAADFL